MSPGVPEEGGVHLISSDGDDRMGEKPKPPLKSLGPPPKSPKSLDQKLTPKNSQAEFPSLKNFQKALCHYKSD